MSAGAAVPDARLAGAAAASVRYLESDAALASLARDPYWPKWDSPWWHMTLLWELGLAGRIPRRAAVALAAESGRRFLKFFPLTEAELPKGADPYRDIGCHCALGTLWQVLDACGLDPDRELPWVRPWFLRYQLGDGGLNCDEAAYSKPFPRSSFLSTLPPAEAVLAAARRGPREGELEFLDRAAEYLLRRGLFRSLSRGGAAREEWLVPCFPRFYDYDVLRGLRFLAAWSEFRKKPLPAPALAAALEDLKAFFGSPSPVPRLAWRGAGTLAPQPGGAWKRGAPETSFPLLDAASLPESAVPVLRREWEAALLSCQARHNSG